MNAANAVIVEPLWTAAEVAAFLRVSLSMVYKLRREGKLQAIQVGSLYRFNSEHVRAGVRGDLAFHRTGAGSLRGRR